MSRLKRNAFKESVKLTKMILDNESASEESSKEDMEITEDSTPPIIKTNNLNNFFKSIPPLLTTPECSEIYKPYLNICEEITQTQDGDWKILEDFLDKQIEKYTRDFNEIQKIAKGPPILPKNIKTHFQTLNKDYNEQIEILTKIIESRSIVNNHNNKKNNDNNELIVKEFLGNYTKDLSEEEIIKSLLLLIMMIEVRKEDWDYYLNPLDKLTQSYLTSTVSKVKKIIKNSK